MHRAAHVPRSAITTTPRPSQRTASPLACATLPRMGCAEWTACSRCGRSRHHTTAEPCCRRCYLARCSNRNHRETVCTAFNARSRNLPLHDRQPHMKFLDLLSRPSPPWLTPCGWLARRLCSALSQPCSDPHAPSYLCMSPSPCASLFVPVSCAPLVGTPCLSRHVRYLLRRSSRKRSPRCLRPVASTWLRVVIAFVPATA